MNCLKDYIGIKSGGSTPPLSGIYINQLPGFTLDKISKIKETENDISSLFDEIQSRAWLRLEKDFRIALRNRYKLKAVKSIAETTQTFDGSQIATSAKYKGIVVDLGLYNHHSSFLSLQVDKISVTLAATVPRLEVKLFDGNGSLVDTLTKANAVAGKNVIQVAKCYPIKKMFVAIDTTSINLQAATIPKYILDNCFEWFWQLSGTCAPSIYGAVADLNSPGHLTKSNYGYGVEVSFSMTCGYDNIICANKPEFTDVWLYLLGSEFMLECMYSTKMNRFTTIDRPSAEELNSYYGNKYEEALAEVIKGLEVKEDDCCIECDPKFSIRQTIP